MNYKKLLFLFTIALAVVSCKNDDDGGGESSFLLTAENLAGTYDHTFFESTRIFTGTFDGLPQTTTTTVTADTYDGEIIISENGTFQTDGAFRKITVKTDGTTTTTNEDIIILNDNGTYVLDANLEAITFSGFEIPADQDEPNTFDNGIYVFTQFSENEIRLMQEFTVESGDETIEYTVEIRFRRQ